MRNVIETVSPLERRLRALSIVVGAEPVRYEYVLVEDALDIIHETRTGALMQAASRVMLLPVARGGGDWVKLDDVMAALKAVT